MGGFCTPLKISLRNQYLKILDLAILFVADAPMENIQFFCWFFFMGASAAKSIARSRIFRYGLRNYILGRRPKLRQGWGVQHPSPWFKGFTTEMPEIFLTYFHKSFNPWIFGLVQLLNFLRTVKIPTRGELIMDNLICSK